jgi:hypothetical protein
VIDEPDNLIGADITRAHLGWTHLNIDLSSVKVSSTSLYWPDAREPDLRGNIIGTPEDFIEIMMQRIRLSRPERPALTAHQLAEQLYREGKLLNLATRRPLTEEEKAERERLAQLFSAGKPMSEMVIEDRGPY